jgi:hypothetical protein
MATIYVAAHGGLGAGKGRAVVPPGMTVKFFTDVGTNLLILNGVEIVRTGQTGNASGEYGHGAADGPWVQNYELSGLEDELIASYLTGAKNEGSLLFVGDKTDSPIKLCAGDGPTNCQGDKHDCSGLLAHADVAGCDEVIILACRGVEGAKQSAQESLGGRADDPSTQDRANFERWDKWTDWLHVTLPTDRAAVDAAYDKLTPEEQAELYGGWPQVQDYVEVRGALYMLSTEGDEAFERYYYAKDDAKQKLLAANADLAAALERRRAGDFAQLPQVGADDGATELAGADLEAWAAAQVETHGVVALADWATGGQLDPSSKPALVAAVRRWADGAVAAHLDALEGLRGDEEATEAYVESLGEELAAAVLLAPSAADLVAAHPEMAAAASEMNAAFSA